MRRHSWQLITGSASWNESEAAHNAVPAGDCRPKDAESGNDNDRDQHRQQAILRHSRATVVATQRPGKGFDRPHELEHRNPYLSGAVAARPIWPGRTTHAIEPSDW